MPILPLDRAASFLDGAIDVRRREGSIQPIRYPAAEALYYDAFTRYVASCPAGVRLRLITSATAIRLATNQRMIATAEDAEPRGAYDLYIDGQLARREIAVGGARMAPDGSLMGDERARIAFENLPAGEKRIELWFPQAGTTSISEVELEGDGHAEPWPDNRPTVLFHGSSISHCMEAMGASAGWPAVAAGLANVRHINLGWAGSCLLSGLAARIIRDQDADVIVLKLGINVHGDGMLKERTFLDSAHAMISIIRERHRTTPVQVISPIFSPPRESEGSNGGPSLQRMRLLLEQVVEARRRSGDANTHYLSGLELFGPADVHDLPDLLHPNTAGYRRMGERFHALRLSGEGNLLRRVAEPA
jgi:lysophospholipase L1-like esterase